MKRRIVMGRTLAIVLVVLGTGLAISQVAHKSGDHSASAVLGDADVKSWGKVEVTKVEKLELDPTTQTTHFKLYVTITNSTIQTIEFSPGLQAYLYDEVGTAYSMTARYTAPGTVMGGPIAANSTWQGSLDFDVAGSHIPKLFVVERDAQSTLAKVVL